MDQEFRDIEQISCEPHKESTMCTIRTMTRYNKPSSRGRIYPVRKVRMEDMPESGSAETNFDGETMNLIPKGDYECEYSEYSQSLRCEEP